MQRIQHFIFFTVTLFMGVLTIQAQSTIGYKIFSAEGKELNTKKIGKLLSGADIILFGEQHNNPISHWLQYEWTQYLAQDSNLILSAEMFEADNQEALNKYLAGTIDQKGLDTQARLWNNYKTDYKPLVDIAKGGNFPFVAANVPRRYASMVYKKGVGSLDSLPANEKAWIVPLSFAFDPELPGYKNIGKMVPHGGENLAKAQAIKDATMAHFIAEHFRTGKQLIHYNGAYHSNNYEGILWYLKRRLPRLDYLTITTVNQKDVEQLLAENKRLADIIIVVDHNMTTTY